MMDELAMNKRQLVASKGMHWLISGLLCFLLAGPVDALQSTDVGARRVWAESLGDSLSDQELKTVFKELGSPDNLLRQRLVEYLGGLKLEGPQAAKRLTLLLDVALEDSNQMVRRGALTALATLGDEPAVRGLDALLSQLPVEEAEGVAQRLSDDLGFASAEARALLDERMIDAFRTGGVELPAPILAILLPAYGRRMAERSEPGLSARDRAPLVLARKHPDLRVRRAADWALEAVLTRMRELERFEQAERLQEQLAADGVESRARLFQRAVGQLHEGGASPTRVLDLCQRLESSVGGIGAHRDERWLARAALIRANALIALDRTAEAQVDLLRAGDLLEGLLARRLDREGKEGAYWQRNLLIEMSLVDFARAFKSLAAGAAADDLALLGHLRKAHITLLRAELLATQMDLPVALGFDLLMADPTSPYRCVFALQPHLAWPATRQLSMQSKLGHAMASISAREMPGFEPFGELPVELMDPLSDPERVSLLQAIAWARVDALGRDLLKVERQMMKRIDMDPALENERAMLSYALRRMRQEMGAEDNLKRSFYDLRRPSQFALLFADDLRRENRNEESLRVAQRLFMDIERDELKERYAWAVQMAARAKLSMGGSLSDSGNPGGAEALLLEGLALFESLQSFYEERGAVDAALSVDDELADALVSLAVNANVKAQDPKHAAEFFERAYELRQDDFMRILLACYRARSGESDSARQLLLGVPPSPRGYYNLACTHALLGDTLIALEWL
ncbi:MAG: hypothetical protein ACI9F9_001603, partial [Candidatus Paceibacteria bacterium]